MPHEAMLMAQKASRQCPEGSPTPGPGAGGVPAPPWGLPPCEGSLACPSGREYTPIIPTFARQAPVDLPQDPGKAARVAETDLARRAEEYIEAYRAAKAQGKEAW